MVEGIAEEIHDRNVVRLIADLENEKYSTEYMADNVCFKLSAEKAFGTAESDPTGSPTRWSFEEDPTTSAS